MPIPLAYLATLSSPRAGFSVGDHLAEQVTDSGLVNSLLDCLPSTNSPAILAPESSRIPLSHRDLHGFISRFALPCSSLRKRLGPNDRIMVVLPTSPENAVALMALATYHTTAPVNASCTSSELKEDATRLGAKAVVATQEAVERLGLVELRGNLGCEIIIINARLTGPVGLFDMAVMMDDTTFRRTANLVPSTLHGMHDYSMVLHTSGTSGKKKVVPYTLRSLIVGTCAVVTSWDLRSQDVNLNMMPLFHVGGVVRNLWAPLFSGGSTIVCAGFDAAAFWKTSMELGATWYYAAPTMHHAILSSRPEGIVASRDTRIRMICNAAGGLLPTLALDLKNTFGGAIVLPSYGMTECMPISTPPPAYQLDRPGCSGVACGPHLSVRDSANIERELQPGQTGAVCVRGLPTFQGYEVSPDLPLDTSAFSSEGWFDTGDCGYMDADAYLYITGRSKEIINKGGEVVSPFEIEEAIMTVAKDRVHTTLAFSIEHDVLQETIGVIIVGSAEHPRISLAELHDLLRDCLHPSKWPFAIVYMSDLPKNAAGKPLRIKLATRLGLGCLTDGIPATRRHFEALTPVQGAALSEPIQCAQVVLDVRAVERTIARLAGVREVAVREREDGSLDAFVSVIDDSISSEHVKQSLRRVLPGYSVPSPLNTLNTALARAPNGAIDYGAMDSAIAAHNASDMSPKALVVRDILAELLIKEPGLITGDSDFFLLGGNSLLLGRLAYFIRKQTGCSVKVSDLFTHSTVNGIADLVTLEDSSSAAATSREQTATMSTMHDSDSMITLVDDSEGSQCAATGKSGAGKSYHVPGFGEEPSNTKSRGQTHPLSLIVQIIPMLFFIPLKISFTYSMLLFVLARMTTFFSASFWERFLQLLIAIFVGRVSVAVVAPILSIFFKWIVIGRYRPGVYRMWSGYHLRWWIVNQFLKTSGMGVFGATSGLRQLYWRLLGATIGRDVHIGPDANLRELDLLTIEDDACIDRSLVRGFCVERDGYFRLGRVHIGRGAVVNTYTQIAPGSSIADGAVYGPHASSHDTPNPESFWNYNRAVALQPHWLLKLFIAYPVFLLVAVASNIPWFLALYGMFRTTGVQTASATSLQAIIRWFASPDRVVWHILARVAREVVAPLVKVFLGIVIKRIMGLNREHSAAYATQMSLLRRFINSSLLSQSSLRRVFDIIGAHYEATSTVFRLMGAKIGRRVYWPGSSVYCPDPELLEIGDDVVFGSRSELFTTDRMGSAKIVVEAGAMIADRVVLLPGTTVGRKAVMGSGTLGKRGAHYPAGTTWMGCENGEAICLGRDAKDLDVDTLTPFGRAFHKRQADFFVIPYPIILLINIFVRTASAVYWSAGGIVAAQMLQLVMVHVPRLEPLLHDKWYNIAFLYGVVAASFVVTLNLQIMFGVVWIVLTKWLVIGRRKVGPCPWDKSSYCQRWKLHLTLCFPMLRGRGHSFLGQLSGSAYIVWYFRALGAKIGKDCSIFAGGVVGLMTEPDLVELGDNVSLDNCSVVAHINSRGMFSLNQLTIGEGCAMRAESRLLSGASMEPHSMLLEHTLLASGETGFEGSIYVGWPAHEVIMKHR